MLFKNNFVIKCHYQYIKVIRLLELVVGITNKLILQYRKFSEVNRRNNNRPKRLPCGTPDTMFNSTFHPNFFIIITE